MILPVFALLLLPLSSYGGSISYVGSSTVGKFIGDASKVYKKSKFKLNTKPESGGGERCAIAGRCSVGGVARSVKPEMLKKGAVATLIGKDAIAAIVNSKNPVKELSAAQLKGIFTGKISNWSELGGDDLAIKSYIVKKGSATRKVFASKLLGGAAYQGAKVITPDAKIVRSVANQKGAIGQISFSFLTGKRGIRALSIDGQAATVKNPNYPVTRPLYLVTKGAPKGDVKKFVEWALSPAGQSVVMERFVGVK
jgi:phosphate transport system substrate-binding protein